MDENNVPFPEEELTEYTCQEHKTTRSGPCEQCADETFSEPPQELLPAVIGFTPKHEELTNELVLRIITQLKNTTKVKSYAIRDGYQSVVEDITVELSGGVTIMIAVHTPTK